MPKYFAQFDATGYPIAERSINDNEPDLEAPWVATTQAEIANATTNNQAAYNTAKAWEELRSERDTRLTATDWRVLADAPEGVDTQAWRDYRQALRDLPNNTQDPSNPTWPSEPN